MVSWYKAMAGSCVNRSIKTVDTLPSIMFHVGWLWRRVTHVPVSVLREEMCVWAHTKSLTHSLSFSLIHWLCVGEGVLAPVESFTAGGCTFPSKISTSDSANGTVTSLYSITSLHTHTREQNIIPVRKLRFDRSVHARPSHSFDQLTISHLLALLWFSGSFQEEQSPCKTGESTCLSYVRCLTWLCVSIFLVINCLQKVEPNTAFQLKDEIQSWIIH